MLLMYVDEAGDPGYRAGAAPYVLGSGPSPFFVRVGVVVHEAKWSKIVAAVRAFRLSHGLGRSDEIHASAIRRGKGPFARLHSKQRSALLRDYAAFVGGQPDLTLVGVAIDKGCIRNPAQTNVKLRSLEFLTERFNSLLRVRKARGLMILDAVEAAEDQMHREFQNFLYEGSAHVQARRFIESCLAEPSETSEFLQMADVCANALLRHRCDQSSDFSLVEPRIYRYRGRTVGLKDWPTTQAEVSLHALAGGATQK